MWVVGWRSFPRACWVLLAAASAPAAASAGALRCLELSGVGLCSTCLLPFFFSLDRCWNLEGTSVQFGPSGHLGWWPTVGCWLSPALPSVSQGLANAPQCSPMPPLLVHHTQQATALLPPAVPPLFPNYPYTSRLKLFPAREGRSYSSDNICWALTRRRHETVGQTSKGPAQVSRDEADLGSLTRCRLVTAARLLARRAMAAGDGDDGGIGPPRPPRPCGIACGSLSIVALGLLPLRGKLG